MRGLLLESWLIFLRNGGRVLGAATSFYALMSTAPMLLLSIEAIGHFTSRADARRQVEEDVAVWMGRDGAQTVGLLLESLSRTERSLLLSALGVAFLFWASTRLFSQLRYALNHLWGIREVGLHGVKAAARRQLIRSLSALSMVLAVVSLLVISVLLKIFLVRWATHFGFGTAFLWQVLEIATSIVVVTLLFALVFRVLPAATVGWKSALVGALVTSLLFSVGAVTVSVYLAHSAVTSMYGAAGSIVVLLIWVNYTAQTFFLGAAFTRVYTEHYGGGLLLHEGAVHLLETVDDWSDISDVHRSFGG